MVRLPDQAISFGAAAGGTAYQVAIYGYQDLFWVDNIKLNMVAGKVPGAGKSRQVALGLLGAAGARRKPKELIVISGRFAGRAPRGPHPRAFLLPDVARRAPRSPDVATCLCRSDVRRPPAPLQLPHLRIAPTGRQQRRV